MFLPYTTLFYVFAYAPNAGVSTFGWILVAFGVLLDLGNWFGSGRAGSRRACARPQQVSWATRVPVGMARGPASLNSLVERPPGGRLTKELRTAARSVLGRDFRGTLLELVDDAGVGQGGGVAEVAALGHVAQQAAHDLAAAGLGQVGREVDGLRLGDRADLGGDVVAQRLAGVDVARRRAASRRR